MMTDERLQELERIARAATPGPWRIMEGRTLVHVESDEGAPVVGYPVCSVPKRNRPNVEHVAAFDPPTVRDLIAEVRRLRDLNEGMWEKIHGEWCGCRDPDGERCYARRADQP